MEVNQETNDTSGKSAFNEKDEKPSFGARPNTKNPDFNFKKELERLPFELNIGDAPLTREQQACLIDMIYDHTEVFRYLTETWGSAMSSRTVYQQLLTNQSTSKLETSDAESPPKKCKRETKLDLKINAAIEENRKLSER